jgi:hypothetical protein
MQEYEVTTMTPTTVPKNLKIGYDLVKNLIFYQVHSFHRRYGGIVDDLIGEANLAFVKSHNQYITGKGKGGKIIYDYASYIKNDIWYRLFDIMRLHIRRKHILKMTSIDDAIDIPDKNLDLFALSRDARFVVALALDPPDYITSIAEAKGGENKNYRSTIRKFLHDQKWSSARIKRVFTEIRSIV